MHDVLSLWLTNRLNLWGDLFMPQHRHARGLGAVGLVTAVACAVVGTPAAHAAGGDVSITASASDATIGITGPGRDIPITVGTDAEPATTTYTNVTVSIDLSGLAGVATATTTQSGCTTTAEKIVCDLGSVSENDSWLTMMLHVTPVSGAKAGGTGQFTLTSWADGVAPADGYQPTTITLADGPDVRFPGNPNGGGSSTTVDLSRGQTYTTPQFTFSNVGSENAEGVTIFYTAAYEAPFVNLASNCQYGAPSTDAGRPTFASCYFPNVIQPGESDTITIPQQLTIRADAIAHFHGFVEVQVVPGYEAGSNGDSTLTWFSGTGPALAIQPATGTQASAASKVAQTDIDPTGQFVNQDFQVIDGVPADLAAVGAKVTAGNGSTTTVTVGAHNNGPGSVDFGAAGISPEVVTFTAPSGTTVTKAPADCQTLTAGSKYMCEPGMGAVFVAGTTQNYTFTLAISAGGARSIGSVTVVHGWDAGPTPGGPDVYDSDWSNDTARVVVNGGPATAPLIALTPNKSAVFRWSGSGTAWTKIGGPSSGIYAGAAGVFATSPSSGAIYQYKGTPGAWTRVGGAGAQFVEGGGRLYALTSGKSAVFEWSGSGTGWSQIGGPASRLYAGTDGLFATNAANSNVYEYSGTGKTWKQVGGPVASLAVTGTSAFMLSSAKTEITEVGENSIMVGGAASSINGGGLGLFATSPSSGALYECTGTAGVAGNPWIKVGGPGSAFSVGDSALFALTPAKTGVWKWSGSGSAWTHIGGPAAQIAAGS